MKYKQMTFEDYDLSKQVDSYLKQKDSIHKAISDGNRRPKPRQEYYDEDTIELAASVKATIRESGIRRPELVDAINIHYGWPTIAEVEQMTERPENHLSLHMFNHYLSKPTEYRMPGALLFAICRITKSLEPCRVIAASAGGDVVTRDEKNKLMLGKLEKATYEMNKLSLKLKKGLR
jgi:hypothetical protein